MGEGNYGQTKNRKELPQIKGSYKISMENIVSTTKTLKAFPLGTRQRCLPTTFM